MGLTPTTGTSEREIVGRTERATGPRRPTCPHHTPSQPRTPACARSGPTADASNTVFCFPGRAFARPWAAKASVALDTRPRPNLAPSRDAVEQPRHAPGTRTCLTAVGRRSAYRIPRSDLRPSVGEALQQIVCAWRRGVYHAWLDRRVGRATGITPRRFGRCARAIGA